MRKRTMQDVAPMPNPLGLDARLLEAGPAAQLMWVRLPAGGRIPPHPAQMVVDFVVVAGAGVALEAGERVPVAAGDIVRFEPGAPHGFDAGEEGMVLVAVKHG